MEVTTCLDVYQDYDVSKWYGVVPDMVLCNLFFVAVFFSWVRGAEKHIRRGKKIYITRLRTFRYMNQGTGTHTRLRRN